MANKSTKLIIGLGFESSVIAKRAESKAEKFCMDFDKVYYPRKRDLTKYKNNYNLSQEEDDFWWCGEDIFENIKEPVFKNLLKNKKTVIVVASKIGQKEAGFINALIKFAKGIDLTLILNKNQVEESLYNHFCRLCNVVDAFDTTEYKEKFYDDDCHIKPGTSILEMEACLNMSFMKRIEETLSRCTRGLRRLTKDERTKIIEKALLEAEKIKELTVAECAEIKRKTLEECESIKEKALGN